MLDTWAGAWGAGGVLNVKYAMLLPLWDGVEEGDGGGAGGGHALGGTRVRGIEWCRERLEAVLTVVVAGREEGV